MEFTAKQVADLIQGRVEGDENAIINSFAKIEEGKAGAISFLSNPKYTHYIYETKSSVVLINEDVELEKSVNCTLIRVKSAYESVAKLLQLYQSMMPKKTGISPLAFVSEKATIGKDCYIAPFVFVGDGVTIGDNCMIYPNVTIYDGCKIGNRVTIHAGAVIGADGFGFAPNAEGYDKIPQIGTLYELKQQKEVIQYAAKEVFQEYGLEVEFEIGTMIEIPRAALTADRIATEAQYFS